jgi:YD repeat-containing protein
MVRTDHAEGTAWDLVSTRLGDPFDVGKLVFRRPVLLAPLVVLVLSLGATPALAAQSVPYLPPLTPAQLTNATVTTTVAIASSGGENSTQTTVDTYEAHGRRVSSTSVVRDASGADISNLSTTYTYDTSGRRVREQRVEDGDGDGPGPAGTTLTVTTYDSKGFVTQKVVTLDESNDGAIDSREVVVFTSDHRNRSTSATFTFDDNGDGIDDEFITSVVTYDAHGNILSSDTNNRDVNGALLAGTREVLTYDAQNRNLSDITTFVNSNGDATSRFVLTSAYDQRGNPVTHQTLSYEGDLSTPDSRQVQTYTYDSKNRIMREDDAIYPATGSTPEAAEATTYGYDDKGRLTSRIRTQQQGTFVGRDTETLTYDSKDRIASYVVIDYVGTPEVIEFTGHTAYTYPTKSMVTTTTTNDVNGDGSIESTVVITRSLA